MSAVTRLEIKSAGPRSDPNADSDAALAYELGRIQKGINNYAEHARGLDARLVELEQRGCRSPGPDGGDIGTHALFGKAIDHPGFAALVGGAITTGRIPVPGGTKAVLTLAPQSSPNLGVAVPAQRRLRLFDFLPVVKFAGGVYEYVRLAGANAAAVQVAPGDLKAESALTAALENAPILTIAVHQQIPRQLISDVPQLLPRLSLLFKFFVAAKAETEVVARLLAGATPMVVTAANGPDALSEAEATLSANGGAPSVAVLHPMRLHALRTARGSDGHFLRDWFGWNGTTQTVWGIPAVANAAVAADQALVLDAQGTVLVDREEATVMISSEDRDNFVKNLITVLGEIRITAAVIVPSVVLKFTLPA